MLTSRYTYKDYDQATASFLLHLALLSTFARQVVLRSSRRHVQTLDVTDNIDKLGSAIHELHEPSYFESVFCQKN